MTEVRRTWQTRRSSQGGRPAGVEREVNQRCHPERSEGSAGHASEARNSLAPPTDPSLAQDDELYAGSDPDERPRPPDPAAARPAPPRPAAPARPARSPPCRGSRAAHPRPAWNWCQVRDGTCTRSCSPRIDDPVADQDPGAPAHDHHRMRVLVALERRPAARARSRSSGAGRPARRPRRRAPGA